MSEFFTVTDYEKTIDQGDYKGLTYAEFVKVVDQELNKFIAMIAALNSDFISPQDVTGVGGLSCRIHSINGYPAVRQMTQFQPKSKNWFVWFDARVLTRAPSEVAPDGSAAAKLEPVTPTEPTSTPQSANGTESPFLSEEIH